MTIGSHQVIRVKGMCYERDEDNDDPNASCEVLGHVSEFGSSPTEDENREGM